MPQLEDSHGIALDWLAQGRRVVAASLIETVGSAPLDAGAEMLVDDAGRIEGSVTGGCVEGALVEEAEAVLKGTPAHVSIYGISDEEAVGVGLMCGGTVHVFVHEIGAQAQEALAATRAAVGDGRPVALATLLDGDHAGMKMAVGPDGVVGTLGVTDLLDHSVRRDALGLLDQGVTAVRRYSFEGEVMGSDLRVYVESFATPPEMVIFGAIDFSAAVARIAGELGYKVTICDARAPFVQSRRFSSVAEIVVDWPDRHLRGRELGPRDVVLVFTHDSKFDEPALMAALETNAGYIGALGSRQTQEDRTARLRALGVDDDALARISAPCGLDIGARTPAETAISILAEVIANHTHRGAGRLVEATAPIHPREAEVG
ncbi:MAG: xanthine dehydrogenase accessory factor [Solirubrobacteraceae bacterium]|jgi:xanthine dehydrogenase accessory factor|nr:xanthine dehydrogenase accessory factor [Solirubrobacteraceae bacterium]